MKDWLHLLEQLQQGEIKELFVTLEEFSSFRDQWKNLPNKMDFRGIASLGGNVTYVYDPDSNPSKKTN